MVGEYLERAMRALAESEAGGAVSAQAAGVHALELARALAPLVAKVKAARENREALYHPTKRGHYVVHAEDGDKLDAATEALRSAERALILALCGAG